MHFILFDGDAHNHFLPFTHTRPVADLRCGILTMRERWELLLNVATATLTADYLQDAFPLQLKNDNIYINGSLFADEGVAEAIQKLDYREVLVKDNYVIAIRTDGVLSSASEQDKFKKTSYPGSVTALKSLPDLFTLNEMAIKKDFRLLTAGRSPESLPQYVTILAPENVFIEQGARIGPCILNATQGPIYIGKDAEIMEGALVRGPFALCDHATLKMGAKVYGATTIGPGCKVGGEISNVVFLANSNKGHDGFLGNAVIGEWCNLGADTNCSNLKNNYDEVKVWSEYENKPVSTGLQFCGLFMGDHSKCGINTMFNTGTVVGVSCNIYGSNFPEKYIPSFSWGGSEGLTTFKLPKAIETANRMMNRRNKQLSRAEISILEYVYKYTEHQRIKTESNI